VLGKIIGVVTDTYLAMILLGVAHTADHRVPAFGFTVSLVFVLILTWTTESAVATTSGPDGAK
jgi:hypothetical protein